MTPDEKRRIRQVLAANRPAKMCKRCDKPLNVEQPRHAQYHPDCMVLHLDDWRRENGGRKLPEVRMCQCGCGVKLPDDAHPRRRFLEPCAIKRRKKALGWGRLNSYGITQAEFEAMLMAQGGGCAICGATSGSGGKALCIDHDHETGQVRGILCDPCNTAIGRLGDSIEGLKKALLYLEIASVRRSMTV